MLSGSGLIPLGSIAGIPVRLHPSFALVLVLALIAEAGRFSWPGFLFLLIVYGPVLLGTVLIHELGHCLATRRAGGAVHGILLWPLGGLAFVGHTGTARDDLIVALAGPATHAPQLAAWLAALAPLRHAAFGSWSLSLAVPSPAAHFWVAVAAAACQVNIALAAFNLLLPCYPLDGGRIFADSLLLAGVGPEKAAAVTAGVAVPLAGGVAAAGAAWGQPLTLMVGLWMLGKSLGLVQAVRQGTVRQHPLFAAACGGEPADGAADVEAAQGGDASGKPLLQRFIP